MADRLCRLFLAVCLLLMAGGYSYAQNDVARQAAEQTLQDVVKRDSEGHLIGTSWGPTTATEHYVPVSSQNLKNAEEALKKARKENSGLPSRPNPPRLVNDFTGILTQEQIDNLTIRCNQFANKTSNQVAIVILPCLYGMSRADAAYKIGTSWGVGQSQYNNGVVFLVKPKVGDEQGEVFIAPGRGLEPVLTDAFTKRIIELRVIPAFKENDYYNGINDALNIIFPVASGEISTDEFANQEDDDDDGSSAFAALVAIIFIIIMIIRMSSHNKNNNFGSGNRRDEDFTAGVILGNMLSSLARGGFGRSGGSWGGSSGGWSGGGFGGFGGGGFSGGGAGGSW
ncbi:MAG: TPM domain-containing protein [Bacteroidales bacterium]|nr:TPM domain-containing protein [Bacteroidales bacterium]